MGKWTGRAGKGGGCGGGGGAGGGLGGRRGGLQGGGGGGGEEGGGGEGGRGNSRGRGEGSGGLGGCWCGRRRGRSHEGPAAARYFTPISHAPPHSPIHRRRTTSASDRGECTHMRQRSPWAQHYGRGQQGTW